MKAKCARLVPTLVAATAAAREREAAKLLGVEVVRVAIHQAAEAGQSGLRLRLPDWLDAVVNTTAARGLMDWARREGLRLDWMPREASLPDGRRVTVVEPEITWLTH